MGDVDYTVPGVVVGIQQPNDWACWATTVTILKSWKDQSSYDIETVLAAIGQTYLDKFQQRTGLFLDEYSDFLSQGGLIAEGPQNYTIEGWESLLRNSGCLWINVSSQNPAHKLWNHARVFYGIHGDGSANTTYFKISDPGNGQLYEQAFSDFLSAYEALIQAENDSDPTAKFSAVPQVIHY
jgi:Papain-like cysteine protease AvrRpt2